MNAKTIAPSKKSGVNVKRLLAFLASEKAAMFFMIVAVLGEWYGVATENDKLTAIWALIAMPFLFRGAMSPQKGGEQ